MSTIGDQLSPGDRMTKRRFEAMARELAKTNGEPSCGEHRMATVVLLEGVQEILDELHKGTFRFAQIEAHIKPAEPPSVPGAWFAKASAVVALLRPIIWPVCVFLSIGALSPYVGPGIAKLLEAIVK